MKKQPETRVDRMRLFPVYSGALPPAVEAITAARVAQEAWKRTPIRSRVAVVRRFRFLLVEQAESLAKLVSGGSRSVSEVLASEILPMADACAFLERRSRRLLAPRRLGARGRPAWLFGVSSEVRREPYGVILVIAPSNYPVFLPGVQVLQALVAGNAVLLKPGIAGAPAAQELARMLAVAGLPVGLLRVLSENASDAREAIRSAPDKVIFTGSARIGTEVLGQLAPLAIPATMELSGTDAVFVRRDADLQLAVDAVVFGLTLNSGRTCIAPARVFVDRAVATEFEGRLAHALENVPGLEFQFRDPKLWGLVENAVNNGAHVLAGRLVQANRWIGPLVLAGVSGDSPLLTHEVFGPFLTLVTVESDEEALALCARSPFALGASIFSRNRIASTLVARNVSAGTVVINDLIVPTADPRLPFGGRGSSGFGLTRGAEGLLEMTVVKNVIRRGGKWRPHYVPAGAVGHHFFLDYISAVHAKGFLARLSSALRLLGRVAGMGFGRRNGKIAESAAAAHGGPRTTG